MKHKNIWYLGIPAIEVKRGIDIAVGTIIELLLKQTRPLKTLEEIEQIATISANGDTNIGKLIAKAIDLVGKDGSVLIQENNKLQIELNIIEGMRLPCGFTAKQFITNERLSSIEYKEPHFLITDHIIETVEQVLPVLTLMARQRKPLIIIAEDIQGEALAAIIANHKRGTMPIAVLSPPKYGEERQNIMKDISIATGGTFFSREKYQDFSQIKLTDFGKAKTIETNKTTTNIMGGLGDPEQIKERLLDIKAKQAETDDLHENEVLQERLSRLQSVVAIIKVGANTEIEMIEKKHRVEDALEAAKAAMEEGVVSGGGCVLARLSKTPLEQFKTHTEGQKFGVEIVKKAIQQPFFSIVENTPGLKEVLFQRLLDEDPNVCYDAAKELFVDAFKAGILDPTKTIRQALSNAASASSTLITVSNAVVEI